MQIGKIYLNNKNIINDNIIDINFDIDNNIVNFSISDKCSFILYGYDNTEFGGANYNSYIKKLDDNEVKLFLDYSIIDFGNNIENIRINQSKYILKVAINTDISGSNYDVDIFDYILTVKDIHASLQNKKYIVVESILYNSYIDDIEIHYADINSNDIYNNQGNLKYKSLSIYEFNNSYIEKYFPNDTYYLNFYKTFQNELIKISSTNISKYSKKTDIKYSIGIIGDFNIDNYSRFEINYNNAINVFNDNNCDFVCFTGNIINGTGENNLFNKCTNLIKSKNKDIYISKSCYDNYYNILDNMNIFKHNSDLEIYRCPNDEYSFYFLKPIDDNNKKFDCFIFLSCIYDINQVYDEKTLEWLSNVLEINKFHRTFLFMNPSLDYKTGSYHYNDEYKYEISTLLKLKHKQYFNTINNAYKNLIIFGGETSYSFDWQIKDKNIIISNKYFNINDNGEISETDNTSGYSIHIPNFNKNLKCQSNNYIFEYDNICTSMIMKCYDNYVELIGYKLSDENNIVNSIYPYIYYKLNIPAQ